ncbi:sulfite reductase [NADPH] flavoprotein alpha-component [Acidiphilium multivorum AIU301]|uniref:Sulfite reductase [NADPH] flavoprotein alpha-component n=1 Tax=Acidiphilium multivorum (strain DSM 11245 / JCM 8867 / NBRC 100883 / AIU 301) TaxID=926570 RepID=F0J5T6_ACIMA|nr:flavodoxin domain-containing protein [Acidiphilium multivorum]BAJ82480.1 sulfite reductase [NADPH] flavoprotein alpha-component [Acidiphilium multivorum AIU301]GAN73447.1 sulfite reductase [Acidiphilium multivorum AIU301]
MTRIAALPHSAPFAPEDIAVLDKVIGRASSTQRAWLAGFLAGIDAAKGDAAAPAAPPAAKTKLTILFATESGNSEALANAAKKDAQKRGFAPRVLDMADIAPAALAEAENLLVIASTWGEGEAPQRAAPFMRALLAEDAPALEGVTFAVLALGDSSYAQFCETGKQIDARLEALGARRIAPRLDCDLDYEAPAANFIDSLFTSLAPQADAGSVIHVDFHRAEGVEISKANPFEAEVAALHPITSSRSESETLHLELDLTGSGLSYEPGDTLGIAPTNAPSLADAILGATGLAGDAAAREALIRERDITTLTPKLIADYAALTGEAKLAALAADEAARTAFIAGRQPLDLFEAFPHRIDAGQLAGLLRKLPPRYYSIASSQKLVGDAAHLAIAKVAYESAGRARLGVASGMVAERLREGDTLPIHIKANPHFRLPEDSSAPIVMIGAGTGIAPYRAFLQEREATGASGRTWLIFGHRRFTHDFLYQLEIQDWLKSGVLNEIDLAFSRDQPEKRYVQHVLWERRAALQAQLAEGATLYLCGDAKAMARDVDATLAHILGGDDAAKGQAALDALIAAGRYKKDVY